MDLHLSANQDEDHYRPCDPSHMDHDWTIVHWEAELVYTDIWVVHPGLCASRESVESLLCHFGKEDSHPLNCPKPLLGVCLSQPSPSYAGGTQHPTSCFLRLRRVVSWVVVALPQLRGAKTLLWPFRPYSRQEACRTVQAVPDLVVLP